MTSDGVPHDPLTSGQGVDLPRLTSLRAFAAFAVFLYHIRKDTAWSASDGPVMHGYVGVGFFFILSGFVLTWSTRPGTSAGQFYGRRFARVYPSHLVMMLVALVVPVIAFPVTAAGVVTNLTLTQAWFAPWEIAFGLNGVSWSLSCEFFFYLCTPWLLMASRTWRNRVAIGVFGGWFAVTSIASVALSFVGCDIWAYVNPLLRSGEFGLGMLFALLASRRSLPRVPLAVGVGLVAVAWFATQNRAIPQTVGDLIFDVPFLALVVAAASADLRGKAALILHSRFMVYAGRISFAYYLVHELVLFNGNLVWGQGPQTRPLQALLTVGVATLCFVVAMALHHGVEKPMQSWLRKVFAGGRPARQDIATHTTGDKAGGP